MPALGQVSDLFGANPAPLPQLLKIIFDNLCVPDLPTTITGTFTDSTTLPWGAHYEQSGTATFVRVAQDRPFAPLTYELASATVTITASGARPVPGPELLRDPGHGRHVYPAQVVGGLTTRNGAVSSPDG